LPVKSEVKDELELDFKTAVSNILAGNEKARNMMKMFISEIKATQDEPYQDNYSDEGMSAEAAIRKIDELLQGNLDDYDKSFMAGEEDQY
jgi:hypothetical protein